MLCIESVYTSDHDSMAGYSGRIGYRYKTSVSVKMTGKYWNILKKKHQIGSLVVDVANCLYKTFDFKQTYNPMIDTKVRAKKGFVTIHFEYFHNSNDDALKMGYNREKGYMRFHKEYKGTSSQYDLDPNNERN